MVSWGEEQRIPGGPLTGGGRENGEEGGEEGGVGKERGRRRGKAASGGNEVVTN